MPTPLFRPMLVVSCIAIAFVTGCRDATAPRVHPMSGTYDFTTALDSVSYELGGPLSCGPGSMYCTFRRADSTGRLSGTFEIGDELDSRQAVYDKLGGQATGVFGGGAVNVIFVSGTASGPLYTSDVSGSVIVVLQGSVQESTYFSGTFAGDSIVGRIGWSQTRARSPTTYSGTFVARRRP